MKLCNFRLRNRLVWMNLYDEAAVSPRWVTYRSQDGGDRRFNVPDTRAILSPSFLGLLPRGGSSSGPWTRCVFLTWFCFPHVNLSVSAFFFSSWKFNSHVCSCNSDVDGTFPSHMKTFPTLVLTKRQRQVARIKYCNPLHSVLCYMTLFLVPILHPGLLRAYNFNCSKIDLIWQTLLHQKTSIFSLLTNTY